MQIAVGRDAVLHQIAGPLTQYAVGRPTIVFVPGVQVAHDLADVLAGYGAVARAIDGTTDRAVRRETLAAYRRGEVQMLVNCGVFTEGFDSPHTSCVAIARPTKSRALYAQMIGRGTRTAPGKTDLLVIDFSGNVGKHSLCGPLDVLGGDPLPDRVRAEAQRELGRGADVLQAERRAKETVEGEDLRASLAEQDALRRRRARTTVDVQHDARTVDPFASDGALGPDDGGPRATAKQINTLAMQGANVAALDLSRAQAAKLLGRLIGRRRAGRCSYKQAKALARAGCDPEMTAQHAKLVCGFLAANRWQRPSSWTRDDRGFYWPTEVFHAA